MRRCILVGTGAFALLASVSLAAAQGMSPPPSKQNANPAPSTQYQSSRNMTSQGQISLTDQQKQMIWQTLSKARAEKAPSNFQASVGSDVPRTMRLHSFTRSLTKQVPAMRGYQYAKTQNEVLIVNPKTRTVIDTVSGS